MEAASTFLDAYEIRARYFPALIVAAPVIATTFVIIAPYSESLGLAAGTAGLGMAFIYVLSLWVRYLGRQIQPKLWIAWGGTPSTRLLRWRDSTIAAGDRTRIHVRVEQIFGIRLLQRLEEQRDQTRADSLIEQAFDQVRTYLRSHDSSGLVNKQNAEYGALRNLRGAQNLFVVAALLGFLTSVTLALATRNSKFVWSAGVDVAFGVIGWLLARNFLPNMVKLAAETYARNAWLTFLQISDEAAQQAHPLR
jgi:hypothetical protein